MCVDWIIYYISLFLFRWIFPSALLLYYYNSMSVDYKSLSIYSTAVFMYLASSSEFGRSEKMIHNLNI